MQTYISAKVSVRFFVRNRTKKGYVSICVQVHHGSIEFRQTLTGLPKVLEKNWDATKRRLKASAELALEINQELNELALKIQRTAFELSRQPTPPPQGEFLEALKRAVFGKEKIGSLVAAFGDYMSELLNSGKSEAYVGKFRSLLVRLTEYAKKRGRELTWADFDGSFFSAFSKFCTDESTQLNTNNSVADKRKRLISFLRWAERHGHPVPKGYTLWASIATSQSDEVALNTSDLQAIARYNDTSRPILNLVRDLFLIQSFTGVRYSDLHSLLQLFATEHEHVRDWGVLLPVRQQKTKGKPVYVPVIQPIIDKNQNNFLLERLPTNQTYNRELKCLAERAGLMRLVHKVEQRGSRLIKEPIPLFKAVSTHTARRTFATILTESGLDPEAEVPSLLGHVKASVTSVYIKTEKPSLYDKAGQHLLRLAVEKEIF